MIFRSNSKVILVGCVLLPVNSYQLFNAQICIYMNQIEFVNESFFANILNKSEIICFHTVKWFQVLLSNTNSFICTQLNVS